MLSKINSCAIQGIDAYIVEVETHMEGNVAYFTIVGLPDNVVKESRERVISAIKNSGYRFLHNKRITINLAPADVKGTGMLIFDYDDKYDDMWIYMPALKSMNTGEDCRQN